MTTYLPLSFLPSQASRLLKPLADLLMMLRGQAVVVGLSGGADSAMLAVCVAELAKRYDISLHCLHIHHGLMENADSWQQQCQELTHILEEVYSEQISRKQAVISFASIAVHVDIHSGLGIEGAAREARYQAFLQYAKQHHIRHFLLAHHLDDQAETLLLRLLRGSGVKGMQGMAVKTIRYVGEEKIYFHRPWLGIERSAILLLADWFMQQTKWSVVQDESNLDIRYKRGVIRRYLTPTLDQYWSSWKQNLTRYARLMNETQQIIDDLSALDFQQLSPSEDRRSFCLKSWRELPVYRQPYVLRYWLNLFHIAMPTDKRLQEWLRQLREVHQLGFDREVRLVHEQSIIMVKRGRVVLLT